MDTLAHGLYGGMIAGWEKRFGWAFLLGMAPDLLSFGPYIALRVVSGTMHSGRPSLNSIPDWVYSAYNVTHSLIIMGVVLALVWYLNKSFAVTFSAWIIHIVFDIPTHSKEFFPTPFIWPLSNYTVDGFSWGQSWFMLINYSALLALATAFIIARHRKRKNQSSTAETQ